MAAHLATKLQVPLPPRTAKADSAPGTPVPATEPGSTNAPAAVKP